MKCDDRCNKYPKGDPRFGDCDSCPALDIRKPQKEISSASNALLSCPFCGEMDSAPGLSETPKIDGGQKWEVTCFSCLCAGPLSDTQEGAEKVWNARAR